MNRFARYFLNGLLLSYQFFLLCILSIFCLKIDSFANSLPGIGIIPGLALW